MDLQSDLLALLSAFIYSLAAVTAKRGNLRGTSAGGGYLVNVVASTVFFTILLPFVYPPEGVPLLGIFWYALSGVLATLLGRAVQYAAIDKMGAAAASPISNVTPVFSSGVAILFLGEKPSLLAIAGTLVMVGGLIVMSRERTTQRTWGVTYMVVPLLSAFFFALGAVTRKIGVDLIPNPVLGVAINTYAALLIYLAFMAATRHKVSYRITREGLPSFALVGLLNSFALIAFFAALTNGLVSVVSPIASVSPLFVLVLAFFFLRSEERLNRWIAAGVSLIVLGTILVSL